MKYEFKFPDVGEGITEGTLIEWLVHEGAEVKEDDVLAKVETDKAVVDIPSPVTGTIKKLNYKEGDVVKVGSVIVVIETESTAETENEENEIKEEPELKKEKKPKSVGVVGELEETEEKPKEILVLPSIRKLAKELNIDLNEIEGTGSNGRITEQDVRNASSGKVEVEEEKPTGVKVVRKYDMYGYLERIPLKGIRMATAKHMSEAWKNVPSVTHMDEVDVTELSHIREKEKLIAEDKGIKLTYLPFVIKALIASLKKNPRFNATLENDEIVVKKYYNVGIAVDTSEGLLVPVIKRAEVKGILELAKEIKDLSDKAKERKLDLSELKGSSFTITNVGSLGGLFATPIVNYPEVAILALGKIHDKPLVIDNEIKIRKVLPLSLAFDHRVVDGADAARFVNDIKKYLEDPELLLLEMNSE